MKKFALGVFFLFVSSILWAAPRDDEPETDEGPKTQVPQKKRPSRKPSKPPWDRPQALPMPEPKPEPPKRPDRWPNKPNQPSKPQRPSKPGGQKPEVRPEPYPDQKPRPGFGQNKWPNKYKYRWPKIIKKYQADRLRDFLFKRLAWARQRKLENDIIALQQQIAYLTQQNYDAVMQYIVGLGQNPAAIIEETPSPEEEVIPEEQGVSAPPPKEAPQKQAAPTLAPDEPVDTSFIEAIRNIQNYYDQKAQQGQALSPDDKVRYLHQLADKLSENSSATDKDTLISLIDILVAEFHANEEKVKETSELLQDDLVTLLVLEDKLVEGRPSDFFYD